MSEPFRSSPPLPRCGSCDKVFAQEELELTGNGAWACRLCRAARSTEKLAKATRPMSPVKLGLLIVGGVLLVCLSGVAWLLYLFMDGFRRAL